MLRRLLVASVILAVGCGGTGLAPLPPPTTAPMLQRALSDTTGAQRVYRPQDVPHPVSLPRGTRTAFVGKDGEVVLRFVVDTGGRLEAETLEWVSGTDATMARWAAARVAEWHFLPARLENGQCVRQLTELSILKMGNTTLALLNTDPR